VADIDIVPKKRSSTWMWIVLAIVVIALLFWLLGGGTQPAARGVPSPGAVASAPSLQPLAAAAPV
jgi:hypothetical protein